ncbi:DUF1338 domain-containing protein [Motilimonas cestriensis]|uniref:2-oxoadipate dioxygenase/decarboxylase n=1 Tax=Motilimonas cestriensis TaxID=2742685 RepID=A0ABS8WAJ7_9GAMM|nr:DUF1338 domain-containing protein [Motilimonas cestriensis]MCE2594611.1 DUF1338 domain-containing protein [Motilimonas cestriensis]
MERALTDLLEHLWQQFIAVTPSAVKIHQLLGQGQPIQNDHIALRTFDLPSVGLEVLARPWLELGYQGQAEYEFTSKKIHAQYFSHPDPTAPLIFISELKTAEFSDCAQAIMRDLVAQLDSNLLGTPEMLYSGAQWRTQYHCYQALLEESEYAAWLAAWGYRANHFTVNVNELKGFSDLAQVNLTLHQAGFHLNTAGGEIKGGADVYLAQSSTVADKAEVTFLDETHLIPSCFYEFAQRYELPNGELYRGFVEASADKIFHSTDSKG